MLRHPQERAVGVEERRHGCGIAAVASVHQLLELRDLLVAPAPGQCGQRGDNEDERSCAARHRGFRA
ncbi:MAG: hypothetical protein U0166_23130 [Acidobacteriota bacterium]